VSALGGCAVGPNFARPSAKVSETWSAKGDPRVATATAVDSLWWKAFDDPVLDQLVDTAYRQNLPLQIAGLRIVEARARLGVATGQQFPQVQVATGTAAAAKVSENVGNVVINDPTFLKYQVGFDAVWELDFWGKYRRGVEAESGRLVASVFDYNEALVSLRAEVARTYVVIRTFEAQIALANANLRVQEEGLKIAESRFRNGATSELDVSQARTLFESTRASVPRLQAGLAQARNALSTLLGQPAGSIDAILEEPREIPKPPEQVALSVPAELLRRRPDINAAEMSAAAQSARIGVAKAELYPSFSLFGSIGLDASTAGPSDNLFAADSLFYSVGPRISWPFFNYGRIKNQVRVEDARFQQSLVNYRETVLRAAQEVEDALTGYLRSQEALTFEQSSVQSAQRSVELSLEQYREGATDYQRVLDAQRSLLQQQNGLAQTQSAVVTNLIALYKALGGGWELREGQNFIPKEMEAEMSERTDWGSLLSQPRAPETKPQAPPETKHQE
jgi:NodT family efflux transporter outer membrane factor (OMF) lipoprotein